MSRPGSRAKRPRKGDEAPGSSSHGSSSHGTSSYGTEASTSPLAAGPANSGTNLHRYQLPSSQPSASIASRAAFGPRLEQQQAMSSSGMAAPPGKVAIPVLRPTYSTESTAKSLKKGRTAHACNNCRKSKAGCTGEMPCPRCKNAGIECEYGDGKREAEKKKMSRLSRETGMLSKQNQDLTEALRRIQLNRSLSADGMRAAIQEVLTKTPVTSSQKYRETSTLSPAGREGAEATNDDDDDNDEDDDYNNGEVGSTGSVDAVSVDPDREEIRPTGHMGKSSSVAWAQRTAAEFRNRSSHGSSVALQDTDYNLPSYHTEDADLSYVVDEDTLDIFAWPDRVLAHELVKNYFAHVHPAFPIIDKLKFEAWYLQAIPGTTRLTEEETFWLSTLNLIFAIAAYHAHVTKAPHRGSYYDHLIYCARAKKLSMDDRLLYHDARLSIVCAMGLQCLYYIATCHLNKAWTFGGLAIRQALTLALHVRSEAEELGDVEKEHRTKIWWCLYSLECLLNELTGRPSCIADTDISTPLPINMSEDEFYPGRALYSQGDSATSSHPSSPTVKGRKPATYTLPLNAPAEPIPSPSTDVPLAITPSTYFIYRTELCIVSHEIISGLYCAATVKVKWSQVQTSIQGIDHRLKSCVEKLPAEFNIAIDTSVPADWDDPFFLPRVGLAMFYTSSRMLLYRPFLCRFDLRLKSKNQDSKEFNQGAVENCILSARKMISLIRWSSTSVDELYTICPWWSTLHNICAALSVLILEMAFRSQHMPDDSDDILEDAKSGIMWLSMMASGSISARKAWEVFDKLIRLVTPLGKHIIVDLPLETAMPAGYNWHRLSRARPDLLRKSQPNPLSQANLQQYQHGQANQSASDATAMWTSQPQSQTSFLRPPPSFEQPASPQGYSNPLDPTEALARFSSMRNMHGDYDEPWSHMFAPISTETNIPIYATHQFESTPVDQPFNPTDVFNQGAAGGSYSQLGQMNTAATFVPNPDPDLMNETPTGQPQETFDPNLGVGGTRFGF